MKLLNITGMVTKPDDPNRPQIRLSEWLDYFGYEDSEFGALMGVTRQSIWRYRHEPNRLNPAIMVRIGEILGIHPEQLWHMPPQRQIPGPRSKKA